MLVLKTTDRRGHADFWEVKGAGPVRFDPRPGWVLVGRPIGARPRKQTELRWLHPNEVRFEWAREFLFQRAVQ